MSALEIERLRCDAERYRTALERIAKVAAPCGYEFGDAEILRIALEALEAQ